MKTLYNRYLKKKLVRWGPNPKPPGGNLCLLGVEPIVSPSCSPINSQLPRPQLRIQLCPTKKKTESGSATPILFLIWESFSSRRKRLVVKPQSKIHTFVAKTK